MPASRRKAARRERAKRDVSVADYRRHRAMARSIGGRIIVRDDGRMIVVGNHLTFDKLIAWFQRLRSNKNHNIIENGFPFLIDGELTEYALKVRGLALHRWRTGLLTEQKQKPLPRRRAKELRAELQEVDSLQNRLERLFDWRRRVEQGELPSGHPFFLDEEASDVLCTRLNSLNPFFPDLVKWYACIVLWSGGVESLDRFLHVLARFPPTPSDLSDVAELEKLIQKLVIFEKRSALESRSAIFREVHMAMDSFPSELREQVELRMPERRRSMRKYSADCRAKCEQDVKDRIDARFRRAPAIIAALCVFDLSTIHLPDRLIELTTTDRTLTDLRATVEVLATQSTEPGYDLLLKHLDEIAPCSLMQLQELLHNGVAVADLQWTASKGLIGSYWHNGLQPHWARGFFEMLEQRGIYYDNEQAAHLLAWIDTADDFAVLRDFAKWFSRLPLGKLSQKQTREARMLIDSYVVPAIARYNFHDVLREWMRRSRRRISCPGVSLDSDLRKSLAGIAHFRKLSGERASLPESWRRELTRPARAEAELAWLRTRAQSGPFTTNMQYRMENLSRRTSSVWVNQEKLLRKSRKVYLRTALESLSQCIRKEAVSVWESVAGYVNTEIAERFPLRFAGWVQGMSNSQKEMLREVIDAWRKHGENYRRHLADNQRWLNHPNAQSLDLDEWLCPEPEIVEVTEGRRIRIKVSQNPIQTFLMGQYFGSCLSLHDCNRMSALTNAYDANKQVLYIYEEDGSLLGRQLVAVSSRGELLGYHCYLKVSRSDTSQREMLTLAIHHHCGRWAKRCGLMLSNEGEPEKIADHFWYDDGEIDWPESARELAESSEQTTKARSVNVK